MATTYGPMFMQDATTGWVAANNGIYKITNGIMARVCTNASNWPINGIVIVNHAVTTGLSIFISRSDSTALWYSRLSALAADVNGFSSLASGSATNLIGLAAQGNTGTLFFINTGKQLYTSNSVAPTATNTLLTTSGVALSSLTPLTMVYGNGNMYVTTSTRVYSISPASPYTITDEAPAPLTSGRFAPDNAFNYYFANNGVRRYPFGGPWAVVSSAAINAIAIFANTGYAVDTAGAVYNVSGASVTVVPPPTTTTTTTTQPPTTRPPLSTTTFGPMYMESATVAWVAANDGIYKVTGTTIGRVCTNNSNLIMTGIGIVGSNLIISISGNATLRFKSTVSLTGDVSEFTSYTAAVLPLPIVCFTSNGSILYLLIASTTKFLYALTGFGGTPGFVELANNSVMSTITNDPTSISVSGTTLYINNANKIYNYPTSAGGTLTTLATASTPGQIAVDSSGNVYITNNGVFQYNTSAGTPKQWTQLSTLPFVSISMLANAGYIVNTSGAVFSFTSNSTAMVIGVPRTLPQPSSQLATTGSVANIVAAIGFTPISTGLPSWANAIVAGNELSSMSSIISLPRISISRADFDAILLSRYGTTALTAEILGNCEIMVDGRVNVPIRR